MGTRADFYVGDGPKAVWLGSIAWDGYPDGIADRLLAATTQEEFLEALQAFASERKDFTSPDRGWPWPWEDSNLTDYAYCLKDGKVVAYRYGRGPFDPRNEPEEVDDGKATWPDMTEIQNVAFGSRSGLIVLGARAD